MSTIEIRHDSKRGCGYVVKGDETDEKIEALRKRGITPVRVVRDDELPTTGDLLTVDEADMSETIN